VAVVGIIPAAGRGERLGGPLPKAFVACGGRPLLEWGLEALEAVCDRVVVAVPPGYEQGDDRVRGADSRSASVRAALGAAPEATVAVVHDAARPLVDAELVRRCVRALDGGASGAVAASPMTDTVKEAAADGRIVRTLERTSLWRIQTPQAFAAAELRHALDVPDAVLAAATDDASLVEACGGVVCVVEAPAGNLKVTGPEDLEVAEIILRRRGRAPSAAC